MARSVARPLRLRGAASFALVVVVLIGLRMPVAASTAPPSTGIDRAAPIVSTARSVVDVWMRLWWQLLGAPPPVRRPAAPPAARSHGAADDGRMASTTDLCDPSSPCETTDLPGRGWLILPDG
ncbi:MAG: hypothetical protein AAF772_14545 [Acidobacteriota bacterium]